MQELSFLKTSNFKYNALKKKKNMRGFFFFSLKREAKSMRGKHKELSHVRLIKRENVAIIQREYCLTLNVMG